MKKKRIRGSSGSFANLPKIYRTMKLICLFMFVALCQVSASVYSQSTKLNITGSNLTLEEVFERIEDQSEFSFIYNLKQIDLSKKVNVEFNNQKVDKILNEILEGTNITYTVKNRLIVVHRDGEASVLLSAVDQQNSISGKVTDEQGLPLPGVTVIIKGTTNGSVTNIDGNYTITGIPVGSILQFSFVGMLTQEVEIGSQTSLDITMQLDAIGIEEVVAIGYGTQKKVNLTGAIGTVEGHELERISTSNLSNALTGLVPGMTVIQSNGRPGSSSSVNIRGVGTWNNSNPLYVIDGIVRDKEAFDALDGNEVESLSVLKDAASASIYGSRAANGVILVSTKRGKIQRPQITYKGTVSIESPTKKVDQLSAFEAATIYNDYMDAINKPADFIGRFAEDELEEFKDESLYESWTDQAWTNPISQQHSLSINGGSEKIRYFMSAGLYDATGFLESVTYDKQNFRMNVEAEITKNLVADVRLDMNFRTSDQPYWPNDGGQYDMWNLYNGMLIRPSYQKAFVQDRAVNYGSWHPFEAAQSGYNKDNQSIFNGIIGLTYSVPWVKGLKLNVKYNQTRDNQFIKTLYEHSDMTTFEFSGSNNHLVAEDAAILGEKQFTVRPYEYIKEKYNRATSYQFNTSVNYENTFGKHYVNGIFVYEQYEYEYDTFTGQAEDFLSTSVDQMFAASDDSERRTATGSGSESGRLSYVGRINYAFGDKYLLESSFRYDGSVKFSDENRWGFFPSVSAGWRISEENFFKDNVKYLDYFKLRASLGNLGNDNVGAFQYVQQYNYSGTMYYDGAFKGLTTGTLPNASITWEKTRTYNVGFDSGFLKNKLTLSGDFFYRHTYDILGARTQSTPGTFGASLPDVNYGIVDVKGLELTAGYNETKGDVTYYVRANIGYAMDEVIEKDVAANSRPYESPIGLPMNTVWGYETEGMLRTQDQLDEYKGRVSKMAGRVPILGNIAYKDIRGPSSDEPDGIVDSNDLQLLSKYASPKLNYGLNLGASWKGLTVDALLQGLGRWDRMMSSNGRRNKINNGNTVLGYWRDHWTPENTDAVMPVAGGGSDPIRQASEFWMQDASFIRLKNLSVRYSLPNSLTSKLGAQDISLLFTGINLLTFTKFEHYDPEQRLVESYPVMKTLSFGLNVTF